MRRHIWYIIFLLATLRTSAGVPKSKHFNIHTIAPGVHAVISKDQGHAICNAGIIDLGDKTLVFDCFISPTAAKDLKRVAETLTGNPVKYVVNSHYHNDHVRGNQCFNEARILATQVTRDLIAEKDPVERRSEEASIGKRIKLFEDKIRSEKDARQKQEYRLLLEYFRAIRESFDDYVMTLPDSIIGDSTWIHGTERKILLFSKGSGHTPNDLVMWLPGEKILFAADLVFIGIHPWLGDGSVPAWLSYLEMLRAYNPEIVVPGHGPVGTIQDISTMKDYLEETTALVEKGVLEGKKADEIVATPIPERFKSWWLSHFFASNLMELYEVRMREE